MLIIVKVSVIVMSVIMPSVVALGNDKLAAIK
jgi:hypothetical protein